jgi:hypothetical protein
VHYDLRPRGTEDGQPTARPAERGRTRESHKAPNCGERGLGWHNGTDEKQQPTQYREVSRRASDAPHSNFRVGS